MSTLRNRNVTLVIQVNAIDEEWKFEFDGCTKAFALPVAVQL